MMAERVRYRDLVSKGSCRLLVVFTAVVSALRIWLIARSDWLILPETAYDDNLQLRESITVFAGDWMGKNYSKVTMPKNPGYPLFLAACKLFRVPYPIGIGLLIVLSAGLFCLAVRPVLKRVDQNCILTILLYTLILYSPMPSSATYRIYRNAIVPWVALLVLSGAIGICLNEMNTLIRYGWASLGFVSIAFFWILREDSIWILPSIAMIAFISVLKVIIMKRSWKDVIRSVIPFTILFLGIPVAVCIVSQINKAYYGLYTVNDRTQTSITKVMKDLYRIDDKDVNRDPDAWLSKKAVQLAMNESKTLSQLSYDTAYSAWAGDEQSDVKGDYPEWALRDAAESAGYYQDAVSTNLLYDRIAEELEDAFETGRLQRRNGIVLSSQIGVLSPKDFTESMWLSLRSLWMMAHYAYCENSYTSVNISNSTLQNIEVWEHALGIEVPRSEEQMDEMNAGADFRSNNHSLIYSIKRSSHIYTIICKIYQVVSYPLFILSCLFFVILTVMVVRGIVNRKKSVNGSMHKVFSKGPDSGGCPFGIEIGKIWTILMALVLAGTVDLYAVVLFSRWISREPASYSINFYASSTYLCLTVFMYLCAVVLAGAGWRKYQNRKQELVQYG